MSAIEDRALGRKLQQGKELSEKQYKSKLVSSGAVVFESDLDLDPFVKYKNYRDRWLIESVFRHYKCDIDLNKTRVQLESSTIGSEFINFIATIITCRMVEKAVQKDLLDKMSFGSLMSDLAAARRPLNASRTPRTDDGQWDLATADVIEQLEKLGLSETAAQPEKKKRGRQKGSKNWKTREREAAAAAQPESPARKRGRPKGSRNRKTLEGETRKAVAEEKAPK